MEENMVGVNSEEEISHHSRPSKIISIPSTTTLEEQSLSSHNEISELQKKDSSEKRSESIIENPLEMHINEGNINTSYFDFSIPTKMNHSHHINNSNTFESSNLLNSHLQHLESSSHLLQNDKINKANMEPFIHINSIHSLQPSQNNNQTFQTINGVVYNSRGYEVCGQMNQHNKPCQRIGRCPFHGSKKKEDSPNNSQTNSQNQEQQPKDPNIPKKSPYKQGWTRDEHLRFLNGLQIHGKGAWKEIALIVGTRTPTQIQSHAQKYYLRQKQAVKNKRSIHDLTIDEMQELQNSGMISPNSSKSSSNNSLNQRQSVSQMPQYQYHPISPLYTGNEPIPLVYPSIYHHHHRGHDQPFISPTNRNQITPNSFTISPLPPPLSLSSHYPSNHPWNNNFSNSFMNHPNFNNFPSHASILANNNIQTNSEHNNNNNNTKDIEENKNMMAQENKNDIDHNIHSNHKRNYNEIYHPTNEKFFKQIKNNENISKLHESEDKEEDSNSFLNDE